MSYLIKLKNVCKTYPLYECNSDRVKELLHPFKKKYHVNVNVLNDVSFEIKKNEVVGIIGKNGAGKSTLLKVIAGILNPTSGEVYLNGQVSALIELGAGFNPEYTGRDNVYFYCMTQGFSRAEVDTLYEEIVNFADIGDYIEQPVKTYSSGMFARLAFSASVNIKPDILIVDEILSVGDVFFQQKCMLKMKDLIKSGSSVIFVSHDMHAVKFFCDRLIFIEGGSVVEDGYNTTQILDFYEKGRISNDVEICAKSELELVEIVETYFTNNDGVRKNRFQVGEGVNVNIIIRINSEENGRFIGFGMRNSDGIYVVGVNTKLDGVELPSKKGEYNICLSFDDVNLYKSVYSCWSVIYNDTGTISQAVYNMKNALEIYDRVEICEGIVNLNRTWEISNVE